MQKPAKYVFQLLYQLSNKEKEGQEVFSTLRPLCRNSFKPHIKYWHQTATGQRRILHYSGRS